MHQVCTDEQVRKQQALGSRLERLETWADLRNFENLDIDEFTSAWAGCVNVRDLAVHRYTIKMAKAIMATSNKHLKSVKVRSYAHQQDTEKEEVMDIFSKGNSSVQETTYDADRNLKMPCITLQRDRFLCM